MNTKLRSKLGDSQFSCHAFARSNANSKIGNTIPQKNNGVNTNFNLISAEKSSQTSDTSTQCTQTHFNHNDEECSIDALQVSGHQLTDALARLESLIDEELEYADENFVNYVAEWTEASNSFALKHICNIQRGHRKKSSNAKSKSNSKNKNSVSQQKQMLQNNTESVTTHCSCISFSNDTAYAAIGFSAGNHYSWCLHTSFVYVWRKVNVTWCDRNPDFQIELSSCCSTTCFYPERRSISNVDHNILTVGLFNGCIKLFKIPTTETAEKTFDLEIASTPVENYTHNQQITDIKWIKSYEMRNKTNNDISSYFKWLLVSCSIDGKILIWNFDKSAFHIQSKTDQKSNNACFPTLGYTCMPTRVYSGHSKFSNDSIRNIPFQLSKIAFVGDEFGTAILCTMNGGIINCSTTFNVSNAVTSNKNYTLSNEAKIILSNVRDKSANYELTKFVENFSRTQKIKIVQLHHVFQSLEYKNDEKASNSNYRKKQIDLETIASKLYPSLVQNIAYAKHIGKCSSLCFNPFSNKNIFMSSGYDETIKIFCTYSPDPLVQLQSFPTSGSTSFKNRTKSYILDSKWSVHRPLVIVCIHSNGYMYVFDLLVSTHTPVVSINMRAQISELTTTEKKNSRTLDQWKPVTLKFAAKDECIYVFDNMNHCLVYQVSKQLLQIQNQELAVLQNWIQSATV